MSIINKGDKFNMLTAIKFSHKKETKQYWLFCCDCGNEKVIRVDSVKSREIKSCGCLNIENKFKHGMAKTRTYKSWSSMKTRCLNKNEIRYKDYGGRGITVCDRWMKFENFYADMGDRPAGKTLDRIKNNLGYCKSNCRWSNPKEQQNNTRANRLLIYNGKIQNIKQWSEELGINYTTIVSRMKLGWTVEKALGKEVG